MVAALLIGFLLTLHDGPDPIAHWKFDSSSIRNKKLTARLGPDGKFNARVNIRKDDFGESAYLNGRGVKCVIADDCNEIKNFLPEESLTVSAWCSIEKPDRHGAIIGTLQDNGSREAGWCVGYVGSKFTFALATEGGNTDGDGVMTYLSSTEEYEVGKSYHVTAVYDGTLMELYVNGVLAASSDRQNGKILYPKSAPVLIGAYQDDNEFFPMKGQLREIELYDIAAKGEWVKKEFEHNEALANSEPKIIDLTKEFVVKPYLQYGTQTGMTVAWQSTAPCTGKVHWGEDISCRNTTESSDAIEINHARLENLKPNTQYFYYVEIEDADGSMAESDVATFQTACGIDNPFCFVVIGDTQNNPAVSGPIAKLAWNHRPNFLLHAGDLVDKGKMNDDWVDEFFPSMHPLISRVPFYPVLGNHEQNARNYFDYMVVPDPEYYYQFKYGNAQFFMIDTNRKVSPDSEQYKWLDKALSESTAKWKFVCHHHPPYSSDENDYGDLWKTNKSTRGDLRARQLVELYDKHDVDVVWNGHIHSYERTWPLKRNNAVADDEGTIYMITGGGGGGLETPGPYRPFFQNTVRRGHHYTVVAINGGTLQLKAFDFDDELFDSVKLEKDK